MQTRTVRSQGNGKFFNCMASVILSLTVSSLVSPTPSLALSFSDSASLDWSALTMTGINFSLSNFTQQQIANVEYIWRSAGLYLYI